LDLSQPGLAFILPLIAMLTKESCRNAATRCVLRAYNAAKCDCGRGSAPDLRPGPRWESLQRSSGPLAGFKGAAGGRGTEGMEGKKREVREGGGGERRGG